MRNQSTIKSQNDDILKSTSRAGPWSVTMRKLQSYGYHEEQPQKDHSPAYGVASVLAGGLLAYE